MPQLAINPDRCKGCGICVSVCPRGALAMDKTALNKNGYYIAEVSDPGKCTHCAICARMCPDCVIAIADSDQ